MITIHEKTAKTFDTIGLGALVPGSCVVEEELNGAYELEMKHPYDEGGKWKRIERGRIIYASTPRGMQPFRIYYVKPSMKEISVNARHIFYDLLDNQCEPISHSGTAGAALTALQAAFAYPMPFSFDTDISITGTLTTGRMNPVQALLSDDDEATSFVKGYGGELLRDGFQVSVKAALGQDRGVSIRYGKNLVGLEVTEDESEVKTRIICYGKNGSVTLDSPHLGDYIYPKIHTLTEENKSISEVQAEAQKLLDEGCDIPSINIKVDFVALEKTVEYREYAVLEEVFLGDMVTVTNIKMGFQKQAKVISYEWDCLLEQYNDVELGDFIPTLAASVTSGVKSGSLASSAAVGTAAVSAALQAHLQDFNNPHHVQAGGIGDMAQDVYDPRQKKKDVFLHEERTDNPHGVTAAQVGVCNRNLLDNWYFGNLVNQRNWTQGATNYQYTIDRWFSNDVEVNVNDGYATVAQSGTSNIFMIQRVESEVYKYSIVGKKITLSALLKNGQLKTAAVTAPAFQSNTASELNVDGLVLGCFSLTNEHGFRVFPDMNKTFDIVAVKAEFGTEQTLAHQENGKWVLNEIPSYAEELAKCQRYFHVYDTEAARPKGANDCVPTMRAEPVQTTLVVKGKTLYANSADL